MEITYLGHSCFKLKGKLGTVVMDPFEGSVGFSMSNASADVVTSSHDHPDHNAVKKVKGTARRDNPFIIDQPGEYEVGGVSVFTISTFHDASQGTERGKNLVTIVYLDQLRVCHLGDLGHPLTDAQKGAIGPIDILLIPVGGHFTINAEAAVDIINELDPSFVIPMHYRTDEHDLKVFGDLHPLQEFLNAYGVNKTPIKSLNVEQSTLPEETEIVVLERQ